MNSNFTNILRIFGLCELEYIDNVKSRYDDSIKSIMITELGVEICKLLNTKALHFLNVERCFIEVIKASFELADYEDEKSFFQIISQVFEPGIIEKTIYNGVEVNRKGTYILKISLDKSTWRTVKISHKNTFDDLHMIIQRAFEFDNDHMYAFYTGTSYKNRKEFYSGSPMGVSDEDEELTIEESEICKGQQFMYIFDFGYMWKLNIKVLDFIEYEKMSKLPKIIESKGESLAQYPDWD